MTELKPMVRKATVALAVLLVISAVPGVGARADDWPVQAAHELRQRLQTIVTGDAARCDAPRIELDTAMVRFYQVRAFKPAWVDRYGLRPEGAMALAVVYQAADQGLHVADYRNPWLEEVMGGRVSRPVALGAAFDGQQIQLELAVTEMVLRYAWHCTSGRTDLAMANFGLPLVRPVIDRLAVGLAEALDRGRLEDYLVGLGPRHEGYRALQQSLPRYRMIQRKGGWPTIPAGPKLKPGNCGPRVEQLQQRLAVTGDYRRRLESGRHCYDAALAAAVARFQRRLGLIADGVAGARTLAALNVPVETRILQIQMSLERWRWMPTHMGARYLLVNIPGFQMEVVTNGRVVRTMRTIVGRKGRPTPVLASKITYLEINPYWYVPHKIAREDLLPKIQANPDFLVRQDFRVFEGWAPGARELNPASIDWSAVSARNFPYRLRQEPAGRNALGRVKFIFPNEMSVYLHDTPAKRLFKKSSRSFSSGCVRVEEPLSLVSLLLDREDWDPERLAQAVASNQRQVIVLDEPVPVYLVYWTAWVAPDGTNHFREDIYGHDRMLANTLVRRAAARTACRTALRLPAYAGSYAQDRRL
ncbi:MAG: L,D-transpeptidase family protein [Desulfobacterales bacterium]|nr:L,D-transpeptidase family protein [Desulfobacterales bacterium]